MDKLADILAHKGDKVYTIDPGSTVFDAVSEMSEQNVGALVVMQTGHVIGIITERDYLRHIVIKGRTSRNTLVRQIMTRKVVYAEPHTTVEEALSIMTEKRIRHLPVMQDEKLTGLVSIGDCVKQIRRQQEVEIKYLKEYIADGYPGPGKEAGGKK